MLITHGGARFKSSIPVLMMDATKGALAEASSRASPEDVCLGKPRRVDDDKWRVDIKDHHSKSTSLVICIKTSAAISVSTGMEYKFISLFIDPLSEFPEWASNVERRFVDLVTQLSPRLFPQVQEQGARKGVCMMMHPLIENLGPRLAFNVQTNHLYDYGAAAMRDVVCFVEIPSIWVVGGLWGFTTNLLSLSSGGQVPFASLRPTLGPIAENEELVHAMHERLVQEDVSPKVAEDPLRRFQALRGFRLESLDTLLALVATDRFVTLVLESALGSEPRLRAVLRRAKLHAVLDVFRLHQTDRVLASYVFCAFARIHAQLPERPLELIAQCMNVPDPVSIIRRFFV